jgi:hypothetical protein
MLYIRCPQPQLAARVFRIYYPSIRTERVSNIRSGGGEERLTGKRKGKRFCAPGKKMPATWRQAVVPGKLAAFGVSVPGCSSSELETEKKASAGAESFSRSA